MDAPRSQVPALTYGWLDLAPQAGPGFVGSGPGSPRRADRVSPPSGPASVSAPASVSGSGNRSDVGSPLGDGLCASGTFRSTPPLPRTHPIGSSRSPDPALGEGLQSAAQGPLIWLLGLPRPELATCWVRLTWRRPGLPAGFRMRCPPYSPSTVPQE